MRRRLDFVRVFCRAQGLDQQAIGKILGVVLQQVNYIFNVADDTRLSLLQRLYRNLGYTLNFAIVRDIDAEKRKILISSKDLVVSAAGYELKRLFFLENAMKCNKISRTEVAARLDMSVPGVVYWFRTDDISISRLFQFCAKFGLTLKIEAIPDVEWPQQGTIMCIRTVISDFSDF